MFWKNVLECFQQQTGNTWEKMAWKMDLEYNF